MRCPVLMLYGEHFIYGRHRALLQSKCAQARVEIVPGGRFCMSWERAEDVADLAREFLRPAMSAQDEGGERPRRQRCSTPKPASLLDLMEQAVKDGRPKLHTLPYAEGRAAVDKMSEDSEAAAARGRRDRSTAASPGPAARSATAATGRSASAAGALPTLIYYHGGGFVIGNIETHDSTCRRLANKSRCQVISIDYRLAPEHPFPAPIEDGVAAFRHIRDNAAAFGADAARIAVGGDSAGGAIAAVVCQACRRRGEAMPAFQMLIYPATDSQPRRAPRASSSPTATSSPRS